MMAKLWSRLPLLVRAPVTGMGVLLVGVYSFGLLANLNLSLWRTVPWSLAVELLILWGLFRYLSGRGWPASTRAARRTRLRARPVPRELLPSTVATGATLAVALFAQMVFAYRLVAMPQAAGGSLLAFLSAPPATAVGILAAGVLMTAFVEEAAFRGYMQQPLEERHGAATAIVVVAVAFAAVHAPPPAMLPLFVFGSLGWGVYVRLASSTLPAMVVHAVIDGIAFAWIYLRPGTLEDLLSASTLENGMDALSTAAGIIAILSAGATVFGFTRMARARARIESCREQRAVAPAMILESQPQ